MIHSVKRHDVFYVPFHHTKYYEEGYHVTEVQPSCMNKLVKDWNRKRNAFSGTINMMTSWSAEPPDFYTSERAFMLKQGLNWTCGYKPAIKCTFCHKTFTSLSARKRHERTVHAMEKNIQCEHCEEKFAYKWLMEAHAAKKHGIGKLFTCACGQTFNRQSNLTQHANICKSVQGPGNETVCKVCTKKFKCKKYLDVHMKFQHDITTLPSVCNICGESFTRPWSLTRHLKRRHAIVDVLSKDTEGGSVSNMSSKEVDTDSDADVSSKEMKSDADISSKEMKSDAYVSSKEIKSDVEVSRKVNQPDTDMSSKKGKSESVVEMSKKERKSDSSADISSKNINTDSVTVMYSNKVTQESISDVSSVETEPDSLVDLPAKKVKIEEA